MRILAEDTLGFVIDFQERLLPVIHNNEELLHKTEKLIKGLKLLGVPMVITQQYTKGIGMTVPSLQEVLDEEFTYFDKLAFSCVDDREIRSKIKDAGKKNVIVCGIEAHICVLQTVIDLIAEGYHVILVTDCIGSRKVNDCTMAIERAKMEGATLTTYESVLFELTRYAGTDVFKQISKLIK